ncbi:MAG: hypothetical protein CMP22_03680 [Rickettsiales bacterium]|nr:hypothetical protein [Rickettsiales bacterium]|tara:strand:+ start:350 stop:856 length:507 start_codon:yes stop_codon:yes gene_type:complete
MDWLEISLSQTLGIILSTALVFIITMIFVRINGLRSFAKLSSYDFAVTIAIGSILGAVVIQKEPSILQGMLAIGTFLLLQAIYSFLRRKTNFQHIENSPLLVMENGEFLDHNIEKANMTKFDIISKLREANVCQLKDAKAVVVEITGDVSVLHGADAIDQILLKDVQR